MVLLNHQSWSSSSSSSRQGALVPILVPSGWHAAALLLLSTMLVMVAVVNSVMLLLLLLLLLLLRGLSLHALLLHAAGAASPHATQHREHDVVFASGVEAAHSPDETVSFHQGSQLGCGDPALGGAQSARLRCKAVQG
jgi:hypothetical protein